MSTLPLPAGHPVAAAAGRMEAELADLAETPLWSMPADQAGATLLALTRARARLEELLMRVLRHAESVETGLGTGATTTTNWWSHTARTTRTEAHRTRRLAQALERHEAVRDALAAGELVTDQARVIVEAVDGLPDDVEAWVPGAATEFLLTEAKDRDATELRVLGRRLLEVVDPEAADAEEARRLEAEERDARLAASLTLTDDGHGTCHGRFRIPSLHGAMLKKHLMALASAGHATAGREDEHGDGAEGTGTAGRDGGPDRAGTTPDERDRPLSRHRLGQAFLEYVETRPADSLPSAGGVPATVVVTMQLDGLMKALGAASLDTGGRISAGEARRLACRAGIIPVVLGGPSAVLDVGRKRRFHTEAQRVALGVRDGGCSAYGCDAPPGLCQAHHDEPWSEGGGTSVRRGRLLCAPHHRLIHDPAFQHSLDKHGKVRFSRRT